VPGWLEPSSEAVAELGRSGFLGEVGRRLAVRQAHPWIRAVPQQQARELRVSMLGRFEQRGESAVLPGVRLRTGLQEDGADIDVAGSGCAVQRPRIASEPPVPGNSFHVRPGLDQITGDIRMAEERGVVQRRESVGRPGIRERLIPPHHRADALGVSDRRSFEHVELGESFGDRRGDVVQATIEGQHESGESIFVPGGGLLRMGLERTHRGDHISSPDGVDQFVWHRLPPMLDERRIIG